MRVSFIFRFRFLFILLLIFVQFSCTASDSILPVPETLVMPAQVVEQFDMECARLAAEKRRGGSLFSLGRDGWCFHVRELQYAAAGPFFGDGARETYPKASSEDANPLSAIIDFRDHLEAKGIELLFIPIPVRSVIFPEGVIPLGEYANSEPLPHLKPMQDEFLEIVEQAGINTVNLSAFFLANRHYERGDLFCRSDTHWTPVATTFAADIVGRYLKSRPWYKEAVARYRDSTKPFTAEWQKMVYFGPGYRSLRNLSGIEGLSPEQLAFRKIRGPGINGENDQGLRHPEAPVVILGDSFMKIWYGDQAGFPQELTFELGFHVDTFQSSGGGINQSRLEFVREIRQHPEYLEGKKAVI